MFLISVQKHRTIVMRFQRVTTIYVSSRNMKISGVLSENFQFLVVKFSIYLNRRVFSQSLKTRVPGTHCSEVKESLIRLRWALF